VRPASVVVSRAPGAPSVQTEANSNPA